MNTADLLRLMQADWDSSFNKGNSKYNKGYYPSDKLPFVITETKNFKRGEDGLIYPKSGPTFPSMIVVLDRRGA